MRTGNSVTHSVRSSETGQCWEERLTNAMGTLSLDKHTPFRVRATGATTVTIAGVLAMTMQAGEIAIFNTGDGDPDLASTKVAVIIGTAAAFVQVGRETYRPKLQS